MSMAGNCVVSPSTNIDASRTLLLPEARRFLVWKSVADVAVAGALFALLAPLILLLILLVRATSRGPALFRQVRLGRDGQLFHVFKLRTMAHDCERLTGPQWSMGRDSRVTSLGRFLRRSHLDELPQLWNVLRREMSLVGPRPERPEFLARLESAVPSYRDRLVVLPGITGLAQVQLPPDESLDDVRRKVACDLCYIQQMSPAMDLKILLGTALKVAGCSFATIRRAFDLPGSTEVRHHERRITAEVRVITQLQSS